MKRQSLANRSLAVAARSGGAVRSASERGSALLIVFVFAAVLAIMLYSELPVVVFEAQRQKEQVLIDRGNEYAHAVKLFVRKFGRFPGSVEELENTNRIRFLRRRFVDPFSGKEDWRIIHAGPGGMIIDSKVNKNNSPNATNGNGQGTQLGSTAFDSSFKGFSNNFANQNQDDMDPTMAKQPPPRPPAIRAGMAPASGPVSPPGANPDSGNPNTADPNAPNPNPSNSGNAGDSPQPVAQQANGQPAAAGNGDPNNQAALMRTLLANQNPQMQTQQNGSLTGQSPSGVSTPFQNTQNTTGSLGQTIGGGFAGVASQVKSHSIKLVNDQSNYSLWEFYFDLQKEQAKALGGALGSIGGGNPNQAMQPGQANSSQNSTGSSGFSLGPGFSQSTSTPSSTNISSGSSATIQSTQQQ